MNVDETNSAPTPGHSEEETETPDIMNLTIDGIADDALQRARAMQITSSNPQSDGFPKAADPEIPKTRADLRREYSDLIEKCQGFEHKDADLEHLSENVARGTQLFQAIRGGPRDMHLAFLHTEMCSGMLKHTVELIGTSSSSSAFKQEAFVESLKISSLEGRGNRYSPRAAATAISLASSECCVTMPHIVAMCGAVNQMEALLPKQPKKPRAAPKRKLFDTNSAKAAKVGLGLGQGQGQGVDPNSTKAELVSQEIAMALEKHHSDTRRAIQLFDFALTKASLAQTVEHIFYVGYLVREGLAALGHQSEKNQKEKKLANLMILPTQSQPPQKSASASATSASAAHPKFDTITSKANAKVTGTHQRPRNQFILSFSPKMFNAMVKSARGEDFLRQFQQGKVPTPKPKPRPN